MRDPMESEAWVLVVGVPVLGLLALALCRWVPPGHVLVVTRRGRVARVAPSGLRVRAPFTTSVLAPTGPDVALLARGATREGIQLRMYVEARTEVLPPAPGQPYADPVAAAAPAAEQVLAGQLGSADVGRLAGLLEDRWDDLTAEVDRATTEQGLRILSLELVELDAVLAAEPAQDVMDPHGPR